MYSLNATFLELRHEVAIFFWPVLYWSVIAFDAECAALKAQGHKYVKWDVTWYGRVRILWVDTPDPLQALNDLPTIAELEAKYTSTVSSRFPSESWDQWRLAEKSHCITPAAMDPSLRWGCGEWGRSGCTSKAWVPLAPS